MNSKHKQFQTKYYNYMRKLNLLRISVLILSLGFMASCGDDDTSQPPAAAPSITVSQSLVDSVYTLGTRQFEVDLEIAAGFKSISVVASAGSAEITSNPDQGDRTGDATVLFTAPATAGNVTVTVTVTDLGDQADSEQIVLRVVEGNLGIEESSLRIIPFHSDGKGSIDITPIAGAAPYVFAWSNGATTEDISDLDPGEYTVTISDASGQTFFSDPFVIEDAGVIMIDGDGNVYRTIEYGGFYWIDRDLQTTSSGDGTAITVREYNFGSGDALYNVGTDLEEVVYVVNEMVIDSLNIDEEVVYYYTLASAAEVCPEGWTLPWKSYMETIQPDIIMPASTASWSGFGVPLAVWPNAADTTAFNLGGINNGEFRDVGGARLYWGAYMADGSGNLANGTVFYNTGNGNGNTYNLFADNSATTDDAVGVYSYWGNNNKNAFCVRCVKKK